MSNEVETDPQLVRRLNIFSAAASLFSIATGTCGLLGWVFGSSILMSWLPGQATMRVNAGVCQVLLGMALWGLRKESPRADWMISRVASRIAAAGVSLIGFLSLLEDLFGWDLRVHQLLHVVRSGEEVGGTRPGLIPLVASVSLALLGISLLALDSKARNCDWFSQSLAGAAGVVSSLGLLDYALGQGSSQTHIAFPSALNFVLLSMGVICARPQVAFGGLLVSQSAGAKWLRRAGPIALVVLIIFGKLTSKALLTDTHLAWIEVSAIAITAGLLLAAHIFWAAFLLDRSERQRLRAEEGLRLSAEKLARWMDRQEDSPVEGKVRRWSIIGITLGILLATLGGLGA